MRLVQWTLVIGGLFCLQNGVARAAPVPSELFGSWTDEPGCNPSGHRMVFAASTVTLVEDDGNKVSVGVDTTGSLDQRLVVRVTKPAAGDGPAMGDVMAIRLQQGELQLLAQGPAGNVHDVSGVPPMHRCAQ